MPEAFYPSFHLPDNAFLIFSQTARVSSSTFLFSSGEGLSLESSSFSLDAPFLDILSTTLVQNSFLKK
jgi:hypothetical protein